ncbi:hypothetical protein [Rhodococcus marinonascens]|uniref:hypothetical protein n=1 Tax=Rhodococcus marinonascens TaxID=38311 RepID=UPI000B04648D
MTEPPNRNDDSAPLDRFSHWFPPFAPAAAPTREAVQHDLPATAPPVEGQHDLPAAAPPAERYRGLPPPPAPTWLSAEDEPSPAPPVRRGRGKRKIAVAVAAFAAIALTGGGVALFVTQSGNAPSPSAVAQSTDAQSTDTPSTYAPDEPPADENAGWCVGARDGATVVGNGPGGTTDGSDAILAFDYAYYVERDGAKAREIAAPDALLGSAEDIQDGIDTLPDGTEHCLEITETETGRYAVTLSELRPGGLKQRYEQVVTTADVGGRTYITSIGASN